MFCLLASCGVFAAPIDVSDQKIAVQNSILTKVNGKTISIMDVKKKMDLAFHQSYPQFAGNSQARLQFYETSWRHFLTDMIDNELIISDALDKEIKVTDGEIREIMEERFGPNVMQTFDKIGLTYSETWKMLKDELIVQRMTWWFIQSKAMGSVTPQDIRQAYRLYLEENPPFTEWKYRVISLRVDQPNDPLSEEIYQLLSKSGEPPEVLSESLKKLEMPGVAIAVSKEFTANDKELSEIYRNSLTSLLPGSYSRPSMQISKVEKKTIYRIFYLINTNDHPASSFENMSQQLRNDLVQNAARETSKDYIAKLRKHYGFNSQMALPEDLHPFSVQ